MDSLTLSPDDSLLDDSPKFWVCVLCYRLRLTLKQLLLAAGSVSNDNGPDKRNRSMLFTSSQPIPIINQMNQSNEVQIASAYNKSLKEFEQNPHQITAASYKHPDDPMNKFEIVCIAGPISEKDSKEIFDICKDSSRGKSHFVAALTLEAKKRNIQYGCNLRALYAVDCDEIVIEEIASTKDGETSEYVKCIFKNKSSSSSSTLLFPSIEHQQQKLCATKQKKNEKKIVLKEPKIKRVRRN